MTEFNCCNCNKLFKKYKSSVKDIHKAFCSKECYNESRTKNVKKIKFKCHYCNKEFFRTERESNAAKNKNQQIKYCSAKCKSDDWGKNRVEVKCFTCDKVFLKQKKDVHNKNFCSKSCQNEHNKTLFTQIKCLECGILFDVKKSYLKTQSERGQNVKFCSNQCRHKHLKKEQVSVICNICGKTFMKNKNKLNIFYKECCSIECREILLKNEHKVINDCKFCGKKIESNYYQNKKYCNVKCRRTHEAKIKEKYSEVSRYLRTCNNYNIWRKNIINRDKSCVKCKKSTDLHAHHIKTLYEIVKDHEFDIDKIIDSDIFNDLKNGITLCAECHIKEHPFLMRDAKGRFCRLGTTSIESPKITNAELSGKTVKP